jgi:hypothetical protein
MVVAVVVAVTAAIKVSRVALEGWVGAVAIKAIKVRAVVMTAKATVTVTVAVMRRSTNVVVLRRVSIAMP